MNTGGAQGGQPPQGQASAGQQQQQPPRPKVVIFKPEQMRQLPPQFSQAEKEKYEGGLRSLYNLLEKNPEDSQAHIDAKRKLFDFSKTLSNKIQTYRAQQAQAAQQSQQAGARPTSQGQPQQPQQTGESSAGNQNAGQQPQRQGPQVSKKLMDHVNGFPYALPANMTRDSPEGTKYVLEAKGRYLKGLHAMESSSARIAALDGLLQKRIEEGRPLSPEEEKDWKEKKEALQKTHSDARTFVDNFRRQHTQQNTTNPAPNANQQGGGVAQQQNANNTSTQETAARPQLNLQQQAPNPASNPALSSTQTVNAAIEAARNQQVGGGRPMQQQNGQMSQGQQMPGQPAPSNMNMPQIPGQNQGQQVKVEGGPPQINTAVNQIQNQHRGSIGNNSPQSAIPQSAAPQSATQQGPPRALSHSAALNQAARSYSSSQSAGPSVMGHSHPSAPARESQNVITNKMPIPKHLPERAAAQPQPVAMAPSRPTYTGGPSNGSGVLSQPVIPQPPTNANTTAAGEHILSQAKLYELVRQVTGGGQGLEGGDILSPDVEASIMDVADNFVDQVLEAACRNAKERGSKILEIRDIQLTLERGYNIRIPGYASDEIRTVRKLQPAPQWIAKMSAVTASKVTGGKNAD